MQVTIGDLITQINTLTIDLIYLISISLFQRRFNRCPWFCSGFWNVCHCCPSIVRQAFMHL